MKSIVGQVNFQLPPLCIPGFMKMVECLCQAGGLDVNAFDREGDNAVLLAARRSAQGVSMLDKILAVKDLVSPVDLAQQDEEGLNAVLRGRHPAYRRPCRDGPQG